MRSWQNRLGSSRQAHSRRRDNSTGDTTTYQCLSSGSFLGKVVRRHACAGLSLSETCHPAGASLPRHYHKHAYFCLVRHGTYREEYGNQRRICSPRMVAFHPPEEIHAQHVDREEVWSFNIEITLAWTRRFVAYELPLNRPFDCTAGPAVGLALRLLDEFENFDVSSPLIVDGLTLELLGVCDRQSRGESAIPRWLRRLSEISERALYGTVESGRPRGGGWRASRLSGRHISAALRLHRGTIRAPATHPIGLPPIGEHASNADRDRRAVRFC